MSIVPMIAVRVTRHFHKVPIDVSKVKRLVRAICWQFEVRQAVVNIGIVDDAEISQLNMRFLNHEGTTDCLSFDLSEEMNREEPRVFDLIVNGELAAREAARRGHDADAELALYVTHGLLHNLGFDDATHRQAQKMHRMEDEILQHLGYGLVYNSDARPQ